MELQYTLDNFEANHTFTNLKEIKHYNYMFTTLRDELTKRISSFM